MLDARAHHALLDLYALDTRYNDARAQLASLELLLNRLPELGPDETRRLIVSLQRGALRLTQLIDNLLESVRIEAGRVVLRRQAVHLDEIVEDAVEMVRPLTDQRGQSIDIALPHPLPVVAADGPRLVQVFVNLLANAGKFAPDNTTIRVGGEAGAGFVTLFVEDDGPGWSEDVEPQLERDWNSTKANSRLGWAEAKGAVRDGWHHIERALPGDADHDGR